MLRTQEQLKIQQSALESTKKQLEITQALVEAGRQARVDLIQNEAAVANRKVDLLGAENQFKEAQLRLLQVLDIERNYQPVAVAELAVEKLVPLKPSELMQVALDKNPSYLISQIDIEIAQLNLLLAEDNRRWDLSFQVDYSNYLDNNDYNDSDLSVSLNLGRQFGNLELNRDVVSRRVQLQQAENATQEARSDLDIQLTNSIRDVNFRITEVELARLAVELSRQQLQNEQEKLRLGRSRIIDIVQLQDELIGTQTQELDAVIAYLNAVTNLEATTGNTLERLSGMTERVGL